MKCKNIIKAVMVTATVLVMASCSSKPKEQLNVGILTDLNSVPFVVGKEKGYFGDNVNIEIFKSAMDRDSSFTSGGLDGASSDVLAACLSREGDFDVYITSVTNGRYGIITYPESGVTNPKTLEGKQVGLSLNTVIEYVTDSIVTASGGDPALLEKIPVQQIPSRLEMIENHQIDAVVMPEPFLSAAEASGNTVLSSSTELGISPGIMLFTGPSINSKQAEIKAFYEAYDKAIKYVNETDNSEFMPYVIEQLGLPESALNIKLPTYDTCKLPSPEDVNRGMDWLMGKGLITKNYDYNDLIREIK